MRTRRRRRAVSLVGLPYAVLMPIFADRILHGGPRGLGLLMGATGLGAVAGAGLTGGGGGVANVDRVVHVAQHRK